MNIEIERKFLVKGPFKQDAVDALRIVQGYICSHSGRTVRVRISGGAGCLTIKGKSSADGLARHEWEKEITLEEAEDLLTLCEPGIIEKTRYMVPVGEHVFEVDEFHGENEGLIVAEVELARSDESFLRPQWLGDEVTGDVRYYNSMLRLKPFSTWK